MARVLILFLFIGAGGFFAPPVRAADSVTLSEVRFVGLKRVPASVLLSESHLVLGVTYNRDELEKAVNRVRRLEFILDADYEIEASNDGSVILVVTISEMAWFNLDMSVDYASIDNDGDWFDSKALTGRYFWKNNQLSLSMVPKFSFVGEDSSVNRFNFNYKRYNLFGRNVVAEIDLTYVPSDRFQWDSAFFDSHSHSDGTFIPHIALHVPLVRNHSLYGGVSISNNSSYRHTRSIIFDQELTREVQVENKARNISVGYLWDTTNNDYLANRGFELRLEYGRSKNEQKAEYLQDYRFVYEAEDAMIHILDPYTGESDATQDYLLFAYKRYRSFANGVHNLSYGGSFKYTGGRLEHHGMHDEYMLSSADFDNSHVALDLGYNYKIWENDRISRWGDLRFHLDFQAGRTDQDSTYFDGVSETYRGSAKLSYRNRWGTASLGVHYFDFDD